VVRKLKPGEILTNPERVKQWLTLHYGMLDREVFGLIFLDARYRYLGHQQLFNGDIQGASVHPRQVARSVFAYNAAAVVAVHIGGLISPALPALVRLCQERGVHLVEDAAHAHGSALGGKSAGTFGVAGAFSFYPTKVMAGGEGGIIVTDDEAIVEAAHTYRDQGKGSFLANFHTRLGANWRMSEPHAAIVQSQLGRLDEFIAARQSLAKRYDAAIDDLGLRPLRIPADAHCNYYKYIAFLPDGIDRAVLKQTMRERFDVGLSGEVYDTPLHQQPVFEAFADRPLPGAEFIGARHICLPLYPSLTETDADYVVESLGTALTEMGLH